jgi:hypothetical protein
MNQLPEKSDRQTAEGDFRDEHFWIAGGKHKQLLHSHTSPPRGQVNNNLDRFALARSRRDRHFLVSS